MVQKLSENEGDGEAIKKSNQPGFYAKRGLVVLKMRMSLDQRSIYIYIFEAIYRPAPFGSLEGEPVLGPTKKIDK